MSAAIGRPAGWQHEYQTWDALLLLPSFLFALSLSLSLSLSLTQPLPTWSIVFELPENEILINYFRVDRVPEKERTIKKF